MQGRAGGRAARKDAVCEGRSLGEMEVEGETSAPLGVSHRHSLSKFSTVFGLLVHVTFFPKIKSKLSLAYFLAKFSVL